VELAGRSPPQSLEGRPGSFSDPRGDGHPDGYPRSLTVATVLDRPRPAPDAAAPPGRRAPAAAPPSDSAGPQIRLLVAVAALLLTACLPLAKVFIGLSFVFTVSGAGLLALAVGWACRRLELGPALTLAATTIAWAAYVSLAFLSDTLVAGVLPTSATFAAGRELWARGLELLHARPSPAYPEAGLLLLTVSGVWAVAHAIDRMVFRLMRPVAAIVVALVMWTVPLVLAPPGARAALWAAPLLMASAGVLLLSADADVGRYARWVAWDDPAGLRTRRYPLARSGVVLAGAAIVVGSLVAGMLPGFGDQALYELRGLGGTTLTSNPIVGIRQRLVASDSGPVLLVRSPRPVYIRTTSLDVYSEREEWTNAGINGTPVEGPVPPAEPIRFAQEAEVDVEVVNLPDAVLVPLPYQTVEVSGEATRAFQYDRGLATFTLDRGASLQPDDRYHALAAIPSPTADQLNSVRADGADPRLTTLPANVPPRVAELSREIVESEGATTRFEQALAIQNHLRGWTYSLEVAEGHSGPAISSFLETQTGYCEQFAGTMAVMLRTLGVPARVAVGFTPGTPTGTEPAAAPSPAETEDFTGDPDRVEELPGLPAPDPVTTYAVTFANAHAWVEVLFPGLGWIAFEPTPRSDQDVLVPTATNLAPSATLRDLAAELTGTPDQPIDDNLNLGVPLGEERPRNCRLAAARRR